MIKPFAFLFALYCLVGFSALAQPDKREWTQLFNGKDLTGWDIKIAGHTVGDNYKNTFRVENGMIRIAYDQYQTFDKKYGHMYFNKPFSHYILRFTYRFVGEQTPGGATWNVRNSGIMFHSQSAQSNSLNQDFPISLEIQTLGGLKKGERHTANLCTPGTQVFMKGKLNPAHCIESKSKTYDGDGWVTIEAVILGDSIVHHVMEGDTVLSYERLQVGGGFVSKEYDLKAAGIDEAGVAYWTKRQNTPLGSGYIALQAESHPIDFRRVEVLNLVGCMDPKALNYKSYFVKSAKGQCRYKK
ncbi:MAG: DUF1080 domain-containing protein [Cytophagales bacterium]|nr:MAG: DUF1080 domain-containing protein [Cytophagales bacterium]